MLRKLNKKIKKAGIKVKKKGQIKKINTKKNKSKSKKKER